MAGASGILKPLDLTDISLPVEEVRNFLVACFEKRFEINPTLFERTVASVFVDHGYNAEVTAQSGDGGIDVILRNAAGSSIGVQVKRYKASIEVEQIRSLAGALLLGGFTRGMFVTTSSTDLVQKQLLPSSVPVVLRSNSWMPFGSLMRSQLRNAHTRKTWMDLQASTEVSYSSNGCVSH